MQLILGYHAAPPDKPGEVNGSVFRQSLKPLNLIVIYVCDSQVPSHKETMFRTKLNDKAGYCLPIRILLL